MPRPAKGPTKKGEKKKHSKVRNWKEYNEVLSNRGRTLFQITEEAIDQCSAHGASDKRRCYVALKEHGVKKVTITSQKITKIWQHGNSQGKRLVRDENLRSIRTIGRKQWERKEWLPSAQFVRDSHVSLEDPLRGKWVGSKFRQSAHEFTPEIESFNKMTLPGMPESYAVA